jgi:hypothetical protein
MGSLQYDIDKVISFVSQKFKDNYELEQKYEGILRELIDLKNNPDSDPEDYKKFIKGYYFGHDTQESLNVNENNTQTSTNHFLPTVDKKNPWWKFWN